MKKIALGELFADKVSNLDPRSFPNEAFELWSIPAFDKGCPKIALGRDIGSAKKCIKANDVLLSRIIPYIRRAWVVDARNRRRQIASTEWIVFRGGKVVPEYLRQFLMSDVFHAQFMQTVSGVGGSLLRARPSSVAKILIPLPDAPEQKRIATILSQANALCKQRMAALQTLRRLTRSVFHDYFGEISRKRNQWPLAALETLVAEKKIGLVRSAAEFGEGLTYSYVRMNAMTRDQEIDFTTIQTTDATSNEVLECSLRKGDFLFNTRNSKELVGKIAVWPGPDGYLFNNNIMRIRFTKDIHPAFALLAFGEPLVSEQLERRKTGTTSVFAIYWRQLKTLPVPVPPSPLQRRFAKCYLEIEALKAVHQSQADQLRRLFESLQHKAFAGSG